MTETTSKTERESNNLILAYGRYTLNRLFGALSGSFDTERDNAAEIAFLVTRDPVTLHRLSDEREASQGQPVFIEATDVFPPGSEPEMRIRKKGETWNAFQIRSETLRETPGTISYARVILDAHDNGNPFGGQA